MSSWIQDYSLSGHDTFIVFVELKIQGLWERNLVDDPLGSAHGHEVLHAKKSEDGIVHLIEPDGLRRMLQFTKGGTLSIHQNVLSYHSGQVDEITIDEKEQSGKGKTRDKL